MRGGSALQSYRQWANNSDSAGSTTTKTNTAYPAGAAAGHTALHSAPPLLMGNVSSTYSTSYSPAGPQLVSNPTTSSSLATLQMMDMQLRILRAREANVKHKQALAQQILVHRQQQPSPYYPQPQPQLPAANYPFLYQQPLPMHYAAAPANPPSTSMSLSSSSRLSNKEEMAMEEPLVSQQSHRSIARSPTDNLLRGSAEGPKQIVEEEVKPRQQKMDMYRPPAPLPRRVNNRSDIAFDSLEQLSRQLTEAVEANGQQLSTDQEVQLPGKKRRQRKERRRDVPLRAPVPLPSDEINTKAEEILPRWKHRLYHNNPNPPLQNIMKSGRLFRTIAWSLCVLVTGPLLEIYRRRGKYRDREKREFKHTLSLFIETLDDWIGRLIQLPLSSMVEDSSLDFDPNRLHINAYQTLLPLKVRLFRIVHSLVEMPLPAVSITALLASLLGDGNYWPEGYFWPSESRLLDFDRLGATRDMLPVVHQPLFGSHTGYRITIDEPSNQGGSVAMESSEDISSAGGKGSRKDRKQIVFDGFRARMVLLNLILVRICIYRLGLGPWHRAICAPPTNRHVRRVVMNLRVVATLLYLLVQSLSDGQLPQLPTTAASMVAPSDPSPTPPSAPTPLELSSKQTVHDISFSRGRLFRREHSRKRMEEQEKGKEEKESEGAKSSAEPSGLLKQVLKVVGFADSTPGQEVFSQDSVEFTLLQPSMQAYCSLDHLHRLLLPASMISPLEAVYIEWIDELKTPLNNWIQALLTHVVRYQQDMRKKERLSTMQQNES
eukprot:gene4287-4707_t